MNLLVDANVPAGIVAYLRSRGHGVLYAAEQTDGIADDVWLATARKEARTLITEDKDFGELVFRKGQLSGTIILLRLQGIELRDRPSWLSERWDTILGVPSPSFVVVTRDKIRIRHVRSA